MASARRRANNKPQGGGSGDQQIALWGACVLLSSISLLVAAASSGLSAASLTGREVGALVRAATTTTTTTTTTSGASVVHGAGGDGGGGGGRYCSNDDDLLRSMSVDGEWVRDADADGDERRRHALYEPGQCPFVDVGFQCSENGRPDGQYAKWRWRPTRCTLPGFDAARLLEILRNRRLVFVGDSLNRNQWISMVCLIDTATPTLRKSMAGGNTSLVSFKIHV